MNAAAQSNSDLISTYLDAVIRKDSSVVDRYFHPALEYMVDRTPTADVTGALPPISITHFPGWAFNAAEKLLRGSSGIALS